MEKEVRQVTVIDADGLILGRMSSYIAKRLLKGEEIAIINAEKAVVSGSKSNKLAEAKEFLKVGGVSRGPYHHRMPDKIVSKAIKGMLPIKRPKGLQAYKRLKTFVGIPNEFKNCKAETIMDAHCRKLSCGYFRVGDLAKEIGWHRNQGD